MKMPLAWNKSCLKNMISSLENVKNDVKRLNEKIARGEREIMFYDGQIIRAEAMGKDSFDEERFGVKK